MKGFSPWTGTGARTSSAGQRAYDEVRRMILHGELRGGALLSEEAISRQLEISRTPAREALRALLHEGLLIEATRRQLRVLQLPRERLEEALELRAICELYAFRAAAESLDKRRIDLLRLALIQQRRAVKRTDTNAFLDLDDEFHLHLAEASGRILATEIIGQLRGYIRVALVQHGLKRANLSRALAEHEAVVDALEDDDVNEAVARLSAHLAATSDLLLAPQRQRSHGEPRHTAA